MLQLLTYLSMLLPVPCLSASSRAWCSVTAMPVRSLPDLQKIT